MKNKKEPRPEISLAMLFVVVGAIPMGMIGFASGYLEGERKVLNEAVEVGVGEYYDNYQTMNREFRWIVVDEKRK
jgi:hypothetical protein